MQRVIRFITSGVLCGLLFQPALAGDDWTQWGGAERNFHVDANKVPSQVELNEVWRRDLGNGYSSILVEDSKLYTMYRDGDDEIVVDLPDERVPAKILQDRLAGDEVVEIGGAQGDPGILLFGATEFAQCADGVGKGDVQAVVQR